MKKEFEPHGVERENDHFPRNNNTKFLISVSAELEKEFSSVQFSSVAQLCPTVCDPMNHLLSMKIHADMNEMQGCNV